MNGIKVFKRPAVTKLWLKKGIPVYLFLAAAVIAIEVLLPVYYKHKYPPVKKSEYLGGLFEIKHKSDVWQKKYSTASFSWYLASLGIASVWMLVLLGPALDDAEKLSTSAVRKAEEAESRGDFSQAIYHLKTAAALSVDERTRKDREDRVRRIQEILNNKNLNGAVSSSLSGAAPDKTVVHGSGSTAPLIANRYKRIRKLGQGGMGIVWLAEDTVLERQIAVKELPVQFTRDEEFKDRFFREAKLLAKLTHPNIVQVYDIIDDQHAVYYTMEFVNGEPLDKIAGATGLPRDKVIEYAVQMLKGIEYAHSMQIIHRDLKPANIIVRKDGIVKIADFGLAKLLGSTSLTMAGTVMGSPMYMSPEQAVGEEADERSDLYSCSMILYELVSGSPAFKGSTTEVIAQQVRGVPALPPAIASAVPWLNKMIIKGLAKDRNRRYQSASEMIGFIEKHRNDL